MRSIDTPKGREQATRFCLCADRIIDSNGTETLQTIARALRVKYTTLCRTIATVEAFFGGDTLINRVAGRGANPTLTAKGKVQVGELKLRLQRNVTNGAQQGASALPFDRCAHKTRILVHANFLEYDSLLAFLRENTANIEVQTTDLSTIAEREVVQRRAQIAICLERSGHVAIKCHNMQTDLVLISRDQHLLHPDTRKLDFDFLAERPLFKPKGQTTLNKEFARNLPTVQERIVEVESADVAFSMARSNLGVSIVPAGDFSVLHRFRKTRELTFSERIGSVPFYVLSADPDTLSDSTNRILGKLLKTLQRFKNHDSPYWHDNLSQVPSTPEYYKGRKYGYFGDIHRDSTGSTTSEPKWYAETVDVDGVDDSSPGILQLSFVVSNLEFEEPHREPLHFRSTGTVAGGIMSIINREASESSTTKTKTGRRPPKLIFTSVFDLYATLPNKTGRNTGVWIGHWHGLWSKRDPRQYTYPALLADRPLSENEIQKLSRMIGMFSVMDIDRFNISIDKMCQTSKSAAEGLRKSKKKLLK